MASIQKKGEAWYCQTSYRGQRKTFTVGRVSEAEAKAKADQADYLLMRIRQGLVEPPADIVAFLQGDGKTVVKAAPVTKQTLGTLRDRYLETHGEGTLEHHTLRGIRKHFRHQGDCAMMGSLGQLKYGISRFRLR